LSKNLVINGVTYNGIESMEINDANGKKVTYVASDEVIIDLPDPSPAAGPGDIAAGKQALDGNGQIMTGTLKFLVELPDLGDYRATANDIVLGKKAINGDGDVIEGTIPVYYDDNAPAATATLNQIVGGTAYGYVTLNERKVYDPSVPVSFTMNASVFGNAEESDVRSGYSFTSKNGLAKTGTAEFGGGGGSETVFYTYLNWASMATFKMRVPYDGITWREYVTHDDCGVLGASVEIDLFGSEQVRVGTSVNGYPIYLNNGGPDALVPIFGETGVFEFVP
jgi:hypothetical protein